MVLSLHSFGSFPDSLLLHHETREIIYTASVTLFNNLSLLNEKRNEDIILEKASNCLEKNDKVIFSCLHQWFLLIY
jgi:hypothetical protein